MKRFLKAYFRANEQLRAQDSAVTALVELTKLAPADQLAMVKGADWYGAADQRGLLDPGGKYIDGLQAGRDDGAGQIDRRRRCASGSTRPIWDARAGLAPRCSRT